mmetsp:Transcript_3493/g.7194  ORF Transcript_3493/g.7194 Transcript_3493/m.7194 type:complete len:237 (+) Transcript_3493:641-1351(+)
MATASRKWSLRPPRRPPPWRTRSGSRTLNPTTSPREPVSMTDPSPADMLPTVPTPSAAQGSILLRSPELASPEWPTPHQRRPPLLMTSSGSLIGPKHGPMVCASPEPPHQVDTPLHLKPSVASMPMPDRLLEHALPTWTALPLPLPSPSPIWCSIPFTPEIGLRDTATMIPTKHRLLDPSESPSSPLKRNAATCTSRTSPEGSARPVYLSKDPWLPPLHPFTFILSGEVVSTKVAV